jgi:putative SOS response-associated peptidase YedK
MFKSSWLKYLESLLRNLEIRPLRSRQHGRVLAPLRSRCIFVRNVSRFCAFCFQQPACAVFIHSDEVGIVRPQVHRIVGVFDGETERLRQLGEAGHVRRVVHELCEVSLEVVIARHIAPTQPVPVIRQNPKKRVRELALMQWGLIPHWAKTPSIATNTINAKSETAATKPAFRDPLKFRRCLIPADGFYEWAKTAKGKQPYCFEVNNGELFAFAGLWDGWKDSNGKWVKTCSILTTTPNAVTSAVHNRMPVILHRDSYDLWLDPGMRDVSAASELLKPYDARLMRCYPVSNRINHVAQDDEACSAPREKLGAGMSRLLHAGRLSCG